MRKKLLFCFCVSLLTTTGVLAQGRTITNFDLEKYRTERVKAEADLRENYARLGFPSPEERARRDAEAARQAGELALKLRAQRIEQERIDAERENTERLAAAYARSNQVQQVYQEPYYWGGYWYSGGWYRPQVVRPRPYVTQPGYYAGGNFWPVGSPIVISPRGQGHGQGSPGNGPRPKR